METKKKWLIPAPIRIPPELIAAAGDALVGEILYRRGYTTVDRITDFLQKTYTACDFSGHELLIPVIGRIEQAVAAQEKITVYGDYDVDGITSTALWIQTLRCLGAQVSYHVPHRFDEGYGVNADVIRALAAAGTRLIITCDCGISNAAEIEEAKSLGIDVLVTDHHELPARLPAVPIFNPKMLPPDHPAFMLPGVGASFIVAKELLRRAGKEALADELLDLLALGIIADVVPLAKDNRWYLKKGLPRLLTSKRPGLKALLGLARIHPLYGTEEDIAFQVIPRLNAAGRLASASLAVELMLTSDQSTADKLAAELNRLNEIRKVLCERMLREAAEQFEKQGDVVAIILYKEDWHEGVMGIVAGRLAEQFSKPALLMTRKENGLITGSARSGGVINIFQVLLGCADLLVKYGGHEGAAGYALQAENLESFRERVLQTVSETAPVEEEARIIDASLCPSQVNMDFYHRVREIGPFGAGNPAPVFCLDGELINNQLIKTGSAHRRLRFAKNGRTAEAVWWHSGQTVVDGRERFIAKLRLNLYRDNVSLQLDIQDVIAFTTLSSPQPVTIGQLIDMRGRNGNELQALFPQALFFGEGVTQNGVSRLELTARDTLVMLTVPPNEAIWAEIIRKVAPRRIVLAWKTGTNEETDMFVHAWQQLRGIIKYALRIYQGVITPQRAAARLGWTGEMVTAGLQALADIGLIQIAPLDDGKLSLSFCHDELLNWRNLRVYRYFTKMYIDMEAYRNYLKILPVNKIKEELENYLNGGLKGKEPACPAG